ncbi:DUF3592 domain-containing protein [Viridibacterium curvum]|uniref:DUF3592 domain-containing protein n=1 Tax=Viridibacterium curvum TaxID=1101404 RepID=A0ABP9QS81_9RHOO
MKLELEDGTVIRKPDQEALRQALAGLGRPGNRFAILSKSGQHYLQAATSPEGGYLIEYREGAGKTHFSSLEADIPHERMLLMFEAYRSGLPWQTMALWEPQYPVRPPRKPKRKSAFDRIVLGVLMFLGLCVLASALFMAWQTHTFIARAIELPGRVVDMHEDGDVLFPLIEYSDNAGGKHVFKSGTGSEQPSLGMGTQVTVLHDPELREESRINSFAELWLSPLIASIIGISLIYGSLHSTVAGHLNYRKSLSRFKGRRQL